MNKSIMNKARSTADKARKAQDGEALETVREATIKTMADYPEKREQLRRDLADAIEEEKKRAAEIENAEDLESYTNAVEAARKASTKRQFIQRELDRIDNLMRMSESEYNNLVRICSEVIEEAARQYRSETERLMEEMRIVKEQYQQKATAVNDALVELDQAANVLQVKYANERRGWKDHAVRYDGGRIVELATKPVEKKAPHEQWDSVLTAAWNAVRKGFPHHTY